MVDDQGKEPCRSRFSQPGGSILLYCLSCRPASLALVTPVTDGHANPFFNSKAFAAGSPLHPGFATRLQKKGCGCPASPARLAKEKETTQQMQYKESKVFDERKAFDDFTYSCRLLDSLPS